MDHQARTRELQRRLADAKLDAFVTDDADTIYYLSGFWGYLAMEFGRATILVVPKDGAPTLITPAMEAEMGRTLSWIADVREWADGVDGEWGGVLEKLLASLKAKRIGTEKFKLHARVSHVLQNLKDVAIADAASIVGEMRMVKSPEEIVVMRQAGKVAVAMLEGARSIMAEGVPEYEIALAAIAGGTRKAATFLSAEGPDRMMSPTIYNLQVMQSGRHTCMVHGRSTVKRLKKGDPVYLCFCGVANFKHFKLGFDREFFVGSATDEQARLYETTVKAQQAALAEIRPGAVAADVHAAAEDVYKSAGLGFGYRTGRAIGYSFLEEPQLKRGDQTKLQAGMTFAVDGGITIPGKAGYRIGDSIVVTPQGFEYFTEYPRGLAIV
jgi:Xaa-Pro aminopeptidase